MSFKTSSSPVNKQSVSNDCSSQRLQYLSCVSLIIPPPFPREGTIHRVVCPFTTAHGTGWQHVPTSRRGRFRFPSVTVASLGLALFSRHSLRGDPGSSYLLPIGVSKDIAAHDVNDIWFRIDFTHQPAQPLPEAGKNRFIFFFVKLRILFFPIPSYA